MVSEYINKDIYDMATAGNKTNLLPPFRGDAKEDAAEWTRKAIFIINLMGLDEVAAKRTLGLALQGKAFDWFMESMLREPDLSVQQLLKNLEGRFLSGIKENEIAQRFLSLKIPPTAENFFDMLRDGRYLAERSYMSTRAIVEHISKRSPSEIRIALWDAKTRCSSFDQFAKSAELAVSLSYNNDGILYSHESAVIINSSMKKKRRPYGREVAEKKSCELHGEGNHSSDECRGLQKLTRIGWSPKQEKGISSVNSNDTINDSSYSLSFILQSAIDKNPFRRRGCISKKEIGILIDTGADVTMIPHHLLPQNMRIQPATHRAIAANGLPIPTKGTINNLKISIEGKMIKISKALVTSTKANYMLLGAPEIQNNLDILLSNDMVQELNYKSKTQKNLIKDTSSRITVNSIDTLDSLAIEIRKKHSDIFSENLSPTTLCSMVRHGIETGDHPPIRQTGERVPLHLQEDVQSEINKLLKQGIIRESTSAWRSRLVIVPKGDDKIRMCVDYRALNEITTKNAYPLPRIDEIQDLLAEAEIFSVVDATAGYHQVAMKEEDMKKTAFAWKGKLYEYTRMPFGLCNAPATFQSLMNNILGDTNMKYAIPYLDDIIIFSRNSMEHKKHLESVLAKLKAAGITLNGSKSKFFQKEIKYLGYIMSKGQIRPDPIKIQAIQECRLPETLKQLRSFLGLANFCSQFIPHFATIAAPLTDFLQGEHESSQKKIEWYNDAERAFDSLKQSIANITARNHIERDRPFILTTDASNVAMGAVLSQIGSDGKERMISTFSKKFIKAQCNYSTTDKELLAIEKGIMHYDYYLRGKNFTLRTDHQALQYMKTASNNNSRILRTALKLQEYQFTPVYIKGETNIADVLSRPIREVSINSVKRLELGENEKFQVLQAYHLASGHGSCANMKFLLKKRYEWPGISEDIVEFVKKCEICLKSGGPLPNTKNRVIQTTYPNELWEIDIIGRIPGKNQSENHFILVATDHYTKWIEAKILRTKAADEVVQAVEELIINKHGSPKRILSDMGLEFDNIKIKDMADRFNIIWEFASPRHHETVGAVERANQTLFNILRRLSQFGQTSWKTLLEKSVQAYNISFHRAINTSPHILKFGKVPIIEIDKRLNPEEIVMPKQEITVKRDKHFEKYKTAIQKGERKVPYNLKEGDSVLIFNPPLSEKFKAKWQTGFKIKRLILPDAYIVVKGNKEYRLNKSHVKLNTAV